MTLRYFIDVDDELEYIRRKDLFFILERLLPIKFEFNKRGKYNTEGKVFFGELDLQDENNVSKNTLRLKHQMQIFPAEKEQKTTIEVKFTDDFNVPIPFRGRILTTKAMGNGSCLKVRPNEKVLAKCEHGTIWTVSQKNEIKHFRSSLPLPKFSDNESFFDVFNGENFLEMLPLMQFLREVCAKISYKSPPLRAAYIFDDPNLHWPKYGYVNYREIAAHAKRENYHVSFATIPMDMWYTHTATANIFRQNTPWLSLLIHGNNHAKEELSKKYSKEKRRALLQQAIRRIDRFEQKYNLRVCRVMVPPHGACSNEMLTELPRNGFESACISTGSLRAHNSRKSWIKTLGFFPSEVIEGCPVLPRAGLNGNVKNAILVAAYLGRPIILRGHHKDLKDGIDVLDIFAQFINSLGNVNWTNLTNLSRLNYLWRIKGKQCRIRPLGNKVDFQLPSEATNAKIEDINLLYNKFWQVKYADGSSKRILTEKKFTLMEAKGQKLSIERVDIGENEKWEKKFKPTSILLIARRILTMARDRLLLQ